MIATPALRGLTVLFPAYNDAHTIGALVRETYARLPRLTDDYEIIVVNDGSRDRTADVLNLLCAEIPVLRVVHHAVNSGYGAALRSGFRFARKAWVFYTDGDGQYDPLEIERLAAAVGKGADVANGYKIARRDRWHRRLIGTLYKRLARRLFGLPIRDVNCDFRLIRRTLLASISLESTSGAIGIELIYKLHAAGGRFVEVPVEHFPRRYGRSEFFRPRHLARTASELARFWWVVVGSRKIGRLKIARRLG